MTYCPACDHEHYPPVGHCEFLIKVDPNQTKGQIQIRQCGEPATHFTKDGLVYPRCEEHR